MRKSTGSLQKKEDQKTRLMQIVRQHLDRYGIKVARWYSYDPESTSVQSFYACMESNRVWIPKPVDTYTFYICMHEIGHIATGPRKYAYLQEMNAEQYAIRKLKQYRLEDPEIVREAKEYVTRTICEDMVWRGLPAHAVQMRVRKWVRKSPKKLKEIAIDTITRFIQADADSVEDFRAI